MQNIITGIIKWLKDEPRRISRAFGYALEGLRSTFLMQAAFRLEVVAAVILVPWVMHLRRIGPPKKGLLIATIVLVLVVELLNTAIEAAVDRMSPDHHPMAKLAKDAGAAAVLVALLGAAFIWWMML